MRGQDPEKKPLRWQGLNKGWSPRCQEEEFSIGGDGNSPGYPSVSSIFGVVP
jgi:hypothetical protein